MFVYLASTKAAVLLLLATLSVAWESARLEQDESRCTRQGLELAPHLNAFHVESAPAIQPSRLETVCSDEPIDRLDDDDDRWRSLKTVRGAQYGLPIDLSLPSTSSPPQWFVVGSAAASIPTRLRC